MLPVMDELDFTEEEIKEQLEKLGYHNVPDERLKEFKRGIQFFHSTHDTDLITRTSERCILVWRSR